MGHRLSTIFFRRGAAFVWPLLALSLVAPLAVAQISPEQTEFFETNIRPVLMEKCYRCHGGRRTRSEFRVSAREYIIRGGESGTPALVPGNPEESRLIYAIRHTDPDFKMPPDEPLPEQAVADLVRWVEMGAPWPRHKSSRPRDPNDLLGKDHWSFKPRGNPQPPTIQQSDWARTPIDNFVLAKLQEADLEPAPEANKATLIRRATIDLTGLPPTPEEVQAFLADDSPDAYENLVERLLASPHYGERWGRHWLDLARYADTTGDATDMPIPEAGKYRDYVIQAFNEDLPYDTFIREQIAGDIIAFADPETRLSERIIATGFLALAPRFGTFKNTSFNLIVDNVMDTVGKSVLGLSLSCARCHDHKYDPITQLDYYAMYGIFGNTRYSHAGSDDTRPRSDFVAIVKDRAYNGGPYDEAYTAQWKLQDKLIALQEEQDERLAADPAAFQEALEKTRAFIEVLEAESGDKEDAAEDEEGLLGLTRAKLASTEERLENLTAPKLEELAKEITGVEQELEEYEYVNDIEVAWGAVDTYKTIVNEPLHIRGEPRSPGDPIPRGFVKFLTPEEPVIPEDQSGRLQFAEWVASPEHPLTARVMANRIWQYHFGNGIVRTSNVFGTQGELPTHPELLDWLANRFIEEDWSVKAMHRLIMLSSTYRTTSEESDAHLERDPSDILLSRFPRRRMEAEVIRDSILSASGTLDLTPYGEHPFVDHKGLRESYGEGDPFDVDYDHNYRSVYLMARRFGRLPLFELFDGPDTKRSTPNRNASTLPHQALFLMNSPFVKENSEAFAKRLLDGASTDAERLDQAYLFAYARHPSSEESDQALGYLSDTKGLPAIDGIDPEIDAWASYCRILFMSNEFLFVD